MDDGLRFSPRLVEYLPKATRYYDNISIRLGNRFQNPPRLSTRFVLMKACDKGVWSPS